jgi:hypothetical protein
MIRMPAAVKTASNASVYLASRSAGGLRLTGEGGLCVPRTTSTSCDQAIFVDQATDASLSSYAGLLKIDWFG